MLDLASAFERVRLPAVWTSATHFNFRRKMLLVLCGYFEHQKRVQFEGRVAEPFQPITVTLPGSKGLSEVMKVYPHLRLKVFVNDITAFTEGLNTELAGIAF